MTSTKLNKMSKKLFLFFAFAAFGLIGSLHAQVTIGAGDAPQRYSVLEIVNDPATHPGGVRLPQMTTVQRDAIKDNDGTSSFASNATRATPYLYEGLTIYNTTTRCVEYYNAHKWVSLCLGTASIYFTPTLNQTPFNEDGSEVRGFYTPQDVPNCTGIATPYSVMTVVGGDFCFVNVTNASTGAFTIGMAQNATAVSRTAIVRVTNNCIGEFKEFIFTQNGNTSLCTPAPAHKPVIEVSNGGTLCANGQVYMNISAASFDAAATYIWTLNGVNKGGGRSFVATEAGNYIVYVGGIGCSGVNVSAPATVTASSSTAANPVVITANNGAVLCGAAGTVTLSTAYAGGGTIRWYKDGLQVAASGLNYSVANNAPGKYVAVLNDGGCDSKESNTITVSKNTTGSSISLTRANITINGVPMSSTPKFCDGGVLQLAITSPAVGVTYSWHVNGQLVGSGVTYSYQLPSGLAGNPLSVEVYAEKVGDAFSCPASEKISGTVSGDTPINALISGASAFCNNDPNGAFLQTTSGGNSYLWTNTTANTTANTAAIAQYNAKLAGSHKVTITTAAGCVSESPAYNVTMQGTPLLNWTVQSGTVGENIATIYTIANTGTAATSYTWILSDPSHGTITPNGLSASIIFTDDATITVTALNNCGTSVPLTLPISVIKARPNAPTLTNPGVTARCGGYQFTIDPTSLAAYPANAKFAWTIGGVAIKSQTISGDRNEFCHVEFNGTGVVTATATVTVDGLTSNVSPQVTVSGSVKTNTSFAITGTFCYDVAMTEGGTSCGTLAQRLPYQATFVNAIYFGVSGSPTPSSVVWSVVNDNDHIVQSLTPSGTGVTIQFDPQLPAKLTGNQAGFSVVLIATVTATDGGCISTYTIKETINIKDCQCCVSMTDTDGNTYPAKLFGTQCWTTVNLRAGKDKSGNLLAGVDAPRVNPGWYSQASAAVLLSTFMASPNTVVPSPINMTQQAFATKYGAMYTWAAAGKVCPAGWHLPSDAEWTALGTTLGGVATAGKNLKADNATYSNRQSPTYGPYAWDGYAVGNANNSGFNAFPAGDVNTDGTTAINFSYYAYWWTSTPSSSPATYRYLTNYSPQLYSNANTTAYYFSVRCLKD